MIHFSDGETFRFPDEDDAIVDNLVEWYRTATDGDVASLKSQMVTLHVQKRHIARLLIDGVD